MANSRRYSPRVILAIAIAMSASIVPSPAVARRGADDVLLWYLAGGLQTFRSVHTATLLDDGRVLLAGGFVGSYTKSEVEVFKPVDGTTAALRSMSHERTGHAAVKLEDGRVLVAGGRGFYGLSDSTEIWDPESGLWEMSAPLSRAREHLTMTRLGDGRVLAAGGAVFGGSVTTAEIFDPRTGVWAPAAPMITARALHTASVLFDGRILLVGGVHPGPDGQLPLAECEIFDWRTGEWSEAAALTVPIFEHTATELPDGRVLVTGGTNGSNSNSAVEVYDPATNAWTGRAPMLEPRLNHTATLLVDGRVLVVGASVHPFVNGCEIYDPGQDSWVLGPSTREVRYQHSATLLTDGRVLVAGGTGLSGLEMRTTEVLQKEGPPPGGLTVTSVEMRQNAAGKWNLIIRGTGFSSEAIVSVGGYGFKKRIRVRSATEILGKGKLTSGLTLDEAIPPGTFARIYVQISGSPDALFNYRRPADLERATEHEEEPVAPYDRPRFVPRWREDRVED